MMVGVGVMMYAVAGMYLTDKAEERYGLTPTEKDHESLREDIQSVMPKISVVEKGNR